MAHLIDKDAILAEIESLLDKGKYHEEYDCAYRDGNNGALYALKGKLDSLEVKESADFQHVNDMCKEKGNSLTQETVSNVWHDMSEGAENGRNIIIIDPKDFYGAVLRKGGSQLKNHNKERYMKWAYIDDIINITNKEEPVSEDLEEAALMHFKDVMEYEIKTGHKMAHITSFKAGAEWKKEQMMAKAINTEASLTMSVPSICISLPLGVNVGDKVKVIVIKED